MYPVNAQQYKLLIKDIAKRHPSLQVLHPTPMPSSSVWCHMRIDMKNLALAGPNATLRSPSMSAIFQSLCDCMCCVACGQKLLQTMTNFGKVGGFGVFSAMPQARCLWMFLVNLLQDVGSGCKVILETLLGSSWSHSLWRKVEINRNYKPPTVH